MPVPSATRSRNMRPCARVSLSAASSTRTGKPSGRITRGAAVLFTATLATGGATVSCAGGAGFVQNVNRSARPASAVSLLTLHLRFPGDQLVLFRVVPKRSERHAQQLRGLGLDAARPLQRLEHEDLPDRLQVVL